jgi:hypothetical protein
MPNEQNSSQARRPHYNRPRRGSDRRGQDRRPSQAQPPPRAEGSGRDTVDVEQIMRDIRAQITTRGGIELTRQQVQELAARRLDAILEPRHLKPELMEQLRRAAGQPVAVPRPAAEPLPDFDEAALYQSHRPLLALIRRWLQPILKLFFNPTPLADALTAVTRRSGTAAAREAELQARQAEWNALHYEVLQRLVTEVARATLDAQQLSMRVESLSAKVDFNERRVRDMENAVHGGRAPARPQEPKPSEPAAAVAVAVAAADGAPLAADAPAGDASKRRRRRRRGRRPGGVPVGGGAAGAAGESTGTTDELDFDSDAVDADSAEADSSEVNTAKGYSAEPESTERDSAERDSAEPHSAEPHSAEPDSAERDISRPDSRSPESPSADLPVQNVEMSGPEPGPGALQDPQPETRPETQPETQPEPVAEPEPSPMTAQETSADAPDAAAPPPAPAEPEPPAVSADAPIAPDERVDPEPTELDFVIEPLARTGEPDAESTAVAWVPLDQLPALDSLSFDHGDTVRAYLAARGRLPLVPILT